MKKSGKGKSPSRPRREPRLTRGAGDSGGYDDEDDFEERPRSKPRRKKTSAFKKFRGWLIEKCIRWGMVAGIVLGIYVFYLYSTLPDVSTLADVKKTPSIIIKAENGTVVGTYGDVYGDYVPYGRLPKNLINAVVATEDRNFFHHHGIDPLGMLRAMVVNVRARHVVQGGSTITQQLAKNVFLTPDRTFRRKIQEILLALELERRYSKQEILTIYLNRVYMGAGNYGVDSASKRYFGHSVRDTTLSEDAILVGLLKAPSRYAPTNNPDLSEERATQVLLNMKDAGYLTQVQVSKAEDNFGDEDSSYRDNHSFGAFYFTDYVLSLIPQYIADQKQDLVITTTLRPEWENAAEDAINTVMDKEGKARKASQAALFSISPDGAIRAMVGGRNYKASQFNRVTQALRQPGSSFKLFVYLAALENGFLPDSQMVDQPINIGSWHPHDYTGKYMGQVTLREAFAESLNSVAVQLAETVGREKVIEMAKRLGITSPLEADPSLALGSNVVTLFDMTRAYATLASGGMGVTPYAITKIETAGGQKLYERTTPAQAEILRQPVVEMMNDMLLAVTTTGTGRGAQIGRPVAGKTGTTSEYKDAWFLGFTPQLVAGVWVGNDDTAPMKKVTGGSLPASIWHHYMMTALKGEPVEQIPSQTGSSVFDKVLPWFSHQPVPGQPQPQLQPPAQQPAPQQQQMPNPVPQQPVQQPPVGQQPPSEPLTTPAPEDEPAPEYYAPPSFWDKLMGNDNGGGNN